MGFDCVVWYVCGLLIRYGVYVGDWGKMVCGIWIYLNFGLLCGWDRVFCRIGFGKCINVGWRNYYSFFV